MVINRWTFFITLLGIPLGILLGIKGWWLLHSEKAQGTYFMMNHGNALLQIRFSYPQLFYRHGKDTIWFEGPGTLKGEEGDLVAVRYRRGHPKDVRVDNFMGIWGDTAIYGGIPLFILLIIALHPQIIPYRARVKISGKKPFISIIQ